MTHIVTSYLRLHMANVLGRLKQNSREFDARIRVGTETLCKKIMPSNKMLPLSWRMYLWTANLTWKKFFSDAYNFLSLHSEINFLCRICFSFSFAPTENPLPIAPDLVSDPKAGLSFCVQNLFGTAWHSSKQKLKS